MIEFAKHGIGPSNAMEICAAMHDDNKHIDVKPNVGKSWVVFGEQECRFDASCGDACFMVMNIDEGRMELGVGIDRRNGCS
jgi:hypothetical protein